MPKAFGIGSSAAVWSVCHIRTLAIGVLALLMVACASSSRKQALQTQIDDLKAQLQRIQQYVPGNLQSAEAARAAAAKAGDAANSAKNSANQALAAAQANLTAMEANNEQIDRMFKRSAPDGGEEKNYTMVRVFYATDRGTIVAPTPPTNVPATASAWAKSQAPPVSTAPCAPNAIRVAQHASVLEFGRDGDAVAAGALAAVEGFVAGGVAESLMKTGPIMRMRCRVMFRNRV
jgi:hypothetical protein